jgi:hypothetical protein
MKIGGWKTKAMFSRYNVMDTKRIRQAMEQGGDYVAQGQRFEVMVHFHTVAPWCNG